MYLPVAPSQARPDTAPPSWQHKSAQMLHKHCSPRHPNATQTLLAPSPQLLPQPLAQSCICTRPGVQVRLRAHLVFADSTECRVLALHRTEPFNGRGTLSLLGLLTLTAFPPFPPLHFCTAFLQLYTLLTKSLRVCCVRVFVTK
jgi:hypothetical protein